MRGCIQTWRRVHKIISHGDARKNCLSWAEEKDYAGEWEGVGINAGYTTCFVNHQGGDCDLTSLSRSP